MAVLLFVLLVVTEIVFFILQWRADGDKRTWRKERTIVNVLQVFLFLFMLIFPGIDVSFRFQALLLLLIFRGVSSGITFLCGRKKEGAQKSKAGMAVSLVGSSFLFLGAMIPAFLFTGYEGMATTGEYGVTMDTTILVDESRVETFENDGSKREIPIYFYYPENIDEFAADSLPLVLFSHGAFGYYESNTSTYMELASHGYVVVSLDHPYHSFFTKDTSGNLITVNPEFINNVMYINQENVPEEEIFQISMEWLTLREADMSFVIDSIKEAKRQNTFEKEELQGVIAKIDVEKIGVMGHSLGGAAAVSLGRERDDISAVCDLDGTMLGEQLGIENGNYIVDERPYEVPLFVVDNESHHFDRIKVEEGGITYANNIVLENAKDAYCTYFEGAGHMNYTDLPLFSPFLANCLGTGDIDKKECIEQMNILLVSFFDCYLKDGPAFTVNDCYK